MPHKNVFKCMEIGAYIYEETVNYLNLVVICH